jgi:transcriptional regulator with XRE-family HTH domain
MIGQKIKELREAQKMSLTTLSKNSTIQLATLSRMENLKMVGTLESHVKIAKALSVNLADLYCEFLKDERTVELQPASHSGVAVVHEQSATEILTSKALNKKMLPVLIKLEAEGKTQLEQNIPGSEKFVFILEGKASAHIENTRYALSKNSSLYFESSQKHFFSNDGKALARLLVVSTPATI